MDHSSRVGAVASSSGVSSSNSGDGGGGEPGNVHGVGGGDIGVASGDGVVDKGSSNGDGGNSLHLSDGGGNNGRSGNSVGVVSVAEAVVVAEAGVRVASISVSGIAQTVVSGVAESVVSVSVVGVSLGISLSLSLPLGNMDDSGRVGDIAASGSVASSDGGDGGSGEAGNADGGRGGDTGVAGSIRGSVTSVAKSSIAGITSIAEAGIASTVAKEVGVSLSGGCRSKEESCLELKLDWLGKRQLKIPSKNCVLHEYSQGTCSCWIVKNFFGTLPTVVSAVVIAGCVLLSLLYEDRDGCKNWFLHYQPASRIPDSAQVNLGQARLYKVLTFPKERTYAKNARNFELPTVPLKFFSKIYSQYSLPLSMGKAHFKMR